MPIKRGFILAAGMGTRMGAIGKELPKVLWPIFDTTLLGIQINFLKKLGVEEIKLNAHHLAGQVHAYCKKNFSAVEVLEEVELLDAGGGIHNYLRTINNYGSVVLLNSDQVINADEDSFVKIMAELPVGTRARLVSMENPGGYSSLIKKGGKLVGIDQNAKGEMYIGLGILNVSGLKNVQGKSKFFETVADYQNESIEVCKLEGEFIDFGTVRNYANGCFRLMDMLMQDHHLESFWGKSKMFDLDRIDQKKLSYNCEQSKVLNFTGKKLKYDWPENSIIISEGDSPRANNSEGVVVYNEQQIVY